MRGLTNEQIARELAITERGVRAQVSRLLKRFGSPNRTALVSVLLESGVIAAARTGAEDSRTRPLVAIPPDRESRLYDEAPFMIAIMSAPSFRITYANERFADALAWSVDGLVGKSYADIFADAPPERVAARDRAAREGELKAVDHGVARWKREDGTVALGVLTYMVHPLWTVDGAIDELLFVGFEQSGSERARGSLTASRSADRRPRRRGSKTASRAARVVRRGLRAA